MKLSTNVNYLFLCTGLSYEYLGWLGFSLRGHTFSPFGKPETKIALTSLKDIAHCVVEVVDEHKKFLQIANKDKIIRAVAQHITLKEAVTKFKKISGNNNIKS